jgi:tRNA (guanine37-N1)-methyltransferase
MELTLRQVEKTLRVTGLDGKAFIQQSARMAWDHPFPPYTPPSSRKKAEKEARSARQAQKASKDASASTASALDQLSLDKEALEPQLVQHFIMNLPDSALTFLDAFRGCLDPIKGEDGLEEKLSALGLPLVHVYCFTRELDPDAAQKDICEVSTVSRPRPYSIDD